METFWSGLVWFDMKAFHPFHRGIWKQAVHACSFVNTNQISISIAFLQKLSSSSHTAVVFMLRLRTRMQAEYNGLPNPRLPAPLMEV
jgi:hypothetical protein